MRMTLLVVRRISAHENSIFVLSWGPECRRMTVEVESRGQHCIQFHYLRPLELLSFGTSGGRQIVTTR